MDDTRCILTAGNLVIVQPVRHAIQQLRLPILHVSQHGCRPQMNHSSWQVAHRTASAACGTAAWTESLVIVQPVRHAVQQRGPRVLDVAQPVRTAVQQRGPGA